MASRWALVRALCAITALSAAVAQTSGFGVGHCPKGFANFGDSLTDTGNAVNAFPFLLSYDRPPYGDTFFEAPAKRFSNGRVVPDFVSLAFDIPLLDGFFATAALNYRYGANFAVGGATANSSANALVPFSLPVQVNQFIRLKKNCAKAVTAQPSCAKFFQDLRGFPSSGSNWLFTIEIGGNDLLNALESGTPIEKIQSVIIPEVVGNVAAAIQTLYDHTARNFLIFGVPAQGCSTVILTLIPFLPRDGLGCAIPPNEVTRFYNAALLAAIEGLRRVLPDSTISYFDYYGANIEVLKNPTTYGFDRGKIFTACCGAPGFGSLNYNPAVMCGLHGSNNCADPDQYVIWDGIHFTDSFYRTISSFVLEGRFTDNPVNYTAQCNLNLSKFGPKETYSQVYPLLCENVYS